MCECVSVSKVCESMSMSVSVWKCVIMSVEVEDVCVCVSVLLALGFLICEKNVETLRPGRGVFINPPPSHMTMGNNADGSLGPHLAGLPLGKLKIAAAYLGKKSHANLTTNLPASAYFSY